MKVVIPSLVKAVPNLAEVEFPFFEDGAQMCALITPSIDGGLSPWEMLNYTCEVNEWHDRESTLKHTLLVIKSARALLRRPKFVCLRKHLDESLIDGRSLHELFTWANVLHDIAKPYTQEIRPERPLNPVLYPRHEAEGANMVPGILGRLQFTEAQIRWVAYIVRFHGDMHSFFGKPEEAFQSQLKDWERQHERKLLYLYLHSWADTIGAKLEKTNPREYDLRLHRYGEALNRLLVRFVPV